MSIEKDSNGVIYATDSEQRKRFILHPNDFNKALLLEHNHYGSTEKPEWEEEVECDFITPADARFLSQYPEFIESVEAYRFKEAIYE